MPQINSKEVVSLSADFQDYEERINELEYWYWKITKELELIQK